MRRAPTRKLRRRECAAALAAPAALLLLAGIYLWWLGCPTPPTPAVGSPWTLIRGDGARITDRDFRGRYLLLYFGYTSCPDVCPTTLAAVLDALRLLGPSAARRQPLFITVDPRRDTSSVVRDYVRNFGPDLIGLTGTPAQVGLIEREYDIQSSVDPAGTDGTYSIDHTAVLILVGPDGRFLAPLPAEEGAAGIARRLSRDLS